ncbi:MAG: hypothetical protein WDO18_19695 [Acidobacteriota bacterium]
MLGRIAHHGDDIETHAPAFDHRRQHFRRMLQVAVHRDDGFSAEYRIPAVTAA